MTDGKPDLKNDSRWRLIERIVASSAFQKSDRLRELLCYLAEKAVLGDTRVLTEHLIGISVFGKRPDYSIAEDSSVRVHVRQLRFKLHEYFDTEGREETCIVEIPKGSYAPVFRVIEPDTVPTKQTSEKSRLAVSLIPWGLALFFMISTMLLMLRRPPGAPPQKPPWPMSALFANSSGPVQIIVADVNYGLHTVLSGQQVTLQQYLSPAYRNGEMLGEMLTDISPERDKARLYHAISGSDYTSRADVLDAIALMRLSGDASDRLMVRSARDLSVRDFNEGNFVLLGGPASNPWVSYFEHNLNFHERGATPSEKGPCFDNLNPKAGEQKTYCGLPFSGSAGVDYATISLLPLPSGHGNVLILQGLQQEGTEAAGNLLASPQNRRELQRSLNISADTSSPVYFEVLIRTQSIAGAPMGVSSLVAVRVLHP
jgi:hypothetical protein